ncbi:hypothetical protein HZA33_04920 [Candidatus Pacearchaeota archaeon]|nr:hypothetical protein [Candidatus Pacearchaeota archaeon]
MKSFYKKVFYTGLAAAALFTGGLGLQQGYAQAPAPAAPAATARQRGPGLEGMFGQRQNETERRAVVDLRGQYNAKIDVLYSSDFDTKNIESLVKSISGGAKKIEIQETKIKVEASRHKLPEVKYDSTAPADDFSMQGMFGQRPGQQGQGVGQRRQQGQAGQGQQAPGQPGQAGGMAGMPGMPGAPGQPGQPGQMPQLTEEQRQQMQQRMQEMMRERGLGMIRMQKGSAIREYTVKVTLDEKRTITMDLYRYFEDPKAVPGK